MLAGGGPFQFERLVSRGPSGRELLHEQRLLRDVVVRPAGDRAVPLDVRRRERGVRKRCAGHRAGDDARLRPRVRRCCRYCTVRCESEASTSVIDLAQWVHHRVPEDSDLDRPALARLATDLGKEPRFWGEFVRHDPSTRHFVQLYRDPHLDLWLICWLDAQDTGYHDHDQSSGAVYVAEGTLHEDHFARDEDGWIREKTREHSARIGVRLRLLLYPRCSARGWAAGDVAARVLPGPVADGPLRDGRDRRARAHLDHVRRRARRLRLAEASRAAWTVRQAGAGRARPRRPARARAGARRRRRRNGRSRGAAASRRGW